MKVKISHDAEQYIIEKGCTVAVMLEKMSGCCGGAAPMPQIQLGVPGNLSDYAQNTIGEITVYVHNQIEMEKQINISLGKLLWLKKLSVEVI